MWFVPSKENQKGAMYKGGNMATIYRKRTNEILWDDSGIYCRLEDEYNELSEFIARKRLDGHDETDQWYMWV